MLRFCAAAHIVLALTLTLAAGSPLEVLESSFRRISPASQGPSGRAYRNGDRAPYEILEQSFKFKDPAAHDPGAFTSAIRSRIMENEHQMKIKRQIVPSERFSATTFRETQPPIQALTQLPIRARTTTTTTPPQIQVRTSTATKPSKAAPRLVRLTTAQTKPSSPVPSSQRTPVLVRSIPRSRAKPTTRPPIKILDTSSRPFNPERSQGTKDAQKNRSNASPPAPRRLVNSMRPFRLHSQVTIPPSVKQKRPTFASGSMTMNENEELLSAPSPVPDAVKSIRDLVENLDSEPYLKLKFNNPTSISPTARPDIAPVTVPMSLTSFPVVKITTIPGPISTSQTTSTDQRKKNADVENPGFDKKIPITQGTPSSSSSRMKFEDVRPGEVNILRLPFSAINRENHSEKNALQNHANAWQVISTGDKNSLQYILHKRPVDTQFLAPFTNKQNHLSDSVPLSQKFPTLMQAMKDSFELLTTAKNPAHFTEETKYSNFDVENQSSKYSGSSIQGEDYFTTSVQSVETPAIDNTYSKFLAKSSEREKNSKEVILVEKSPSIFKDSKDSVEKFALKINSSVTQKQNLLNDVSDFEEKFPGKINALEDMSPTGIITYYEKLKHDIYEILNQLQQNQQIEAYKLENEEYLKPQGEEEEEEKEEEEEQPPVSTKPMMNYNYGEEQESPKIDIEKVLQIMRNFKARISAEEVPESKLYDIAESIVNYINEKEKQSSTKFSYEAEGDSQQKLRPAYNTPPYNSGPSEYDYHYVYYDDMGNEYLPEESNLYTKNKIISPSDEFTKAFLAKHTSKLSAMLTEVLQNAANNKPTLINPLDFLETSFDNASIASSIHPTLTPQVHSIFTPFNQVPLSENPPATTTLFPFEAVVTSSTTSPYVTSTTISPYPTPTTAYPYQPEEMGSSEPNTIDTTTNEIPTTTPVSTTTKRKPETTTLPSIESSFLDTQKRQSSTSSTSNKRPLTEEPNTRWTSIGPLSSPNRKKNNLTPQPNQIFPHRRPQNTNAKVKYDYDKSNEEKEFGKPGAGSKVLPHPGAGNTALETLAGAGAVALMAYGISYALPLAAPLVLRRSDTSRESPISRLMNWLDISGSNKKKRRKGVRKVFKPTSGYPMISIRNSTMLEPLNYDDYDDDYDADYYESEKMDQMIDRYEDYPTEEIPTRYRSDFKGTIPYEDSHYPFPSKFNHLSRMDTVLPSNGKIEDRSNIRAPTEHIGSDFFSFGYDPTDGAIGDDPPNESAVFGKVTYEYDFTNTHINPAVVGANVRSGHHGFSDGHSQLPSKGEIPARGTDLRGAPVRPGVASLPRADRQPKPPPSSNFLSNIFGNIFRRRSNTANIPLPKAPRRVPPNVGPIRGPRVPPHGQRRTVVKSSENPSYPHRPVEVVKSVPTRGLPIHFSHPGPFRTPIGVRPRIDGEIFSKEAVNRNDDIAVGGGGAILPSDLAKTGGGGISLPPQSVSSINTRPNNKHPQLPSYISLEQVNRLADEEMEGVVRGYSRLYDAPWPPPEGSHIIEEKMDTVVADSKTYLFDETDLENGYHLNADSTDYIYKTNDNSYKNSANSHGVETKPATLKTLAPDYNDFDYVDIKGSSADIETKRSFSFPVASSTRK